MTIIADCDASNENRSDATDIPIIDVQEYINNGKTAKEQCRKVAESLHQHGILIVKDSVSIHMVLNNFFWLGDNVSEKRKSFFRELLKETMQRF